MTEKEMRDNYDFPFDGIHVLFKNGKRYSRFILEERK